MTMFFQSALLIQQELTHSTHVTISKPEGLFNAPITIIVTELVIKRSASAKDVLFFRHDDDLDYQDAIDLIDESLLTRI